MGNSTTVPYVPQYISKTVEILVDEGHSLSEQLKRAECTYCTQSVWAYAKGGHGDTTVECFCLKTHTIKWNGTIRFLPTSCDGFTDKPLTATAEE